MDPEWSAHGNLAPASSACLHELVAATCVGTDHETDRSIVPASFHLHDPAVSALALVVEVDEYALADHLGGAADLREADVRRCAKAQWHRQRLARAGAVPDVVARCRPECVGAAEAGIVEMS